METLYFSLKVISPAFVAGGMEKTAQTHLRDRDGNIPKHRLIGSEGDSLRIPSLKGILRFWYRSMYGHLSVEQLKKKEGEIWGDTQIGQGIRLIPIGQSEWKPMPLGKTNQNDQDDKFIAGGSAQAYLGYGPLNYVVKNVGVSSYNKFAFRDAIPEGTLFDFCAMGNEIQIKQLQRALTLFHLFGGIGGRSRRGWGSVAVEGDFIPSIQKGETIDNWFSRVLNCVWTNEITENEQSFKIPSEITSLPSFSAFYKKTQIRISQNGYTTYQEVMDEFFARFKRTRLWNRHNASKSPPIAQHDHNLEEKDANSGTDDISGVPYRLAFGMPYAAESRRNHWRIEYFGFYPDPSNPGQLKKIDRRASPLFLKILEAPDGKLYAVSLFLKSKFWGNPATEIGRKETGNRKPFPGWKAVEEFLNNPNWLRINVP